MFLFPFHFGTIKTQLKLKQSSQIDLGFHSTLVRLRREKFSGLVVRFAVSIPLWYD